MKIKQLKKEIKGVFKPPKKKYYFGKIKYGTPYFNPMGFEPWIFYVRKLEKKSNEELREYYERYPHLKNFLKGENIYKNIPMVRRNKYWIKRIFGNEYFISIGYPFAITNIQLGWKWKFDDIRYEWMPSFQIFIFNWQFVKIYLAPDGDNDKYYEMILHWMKKCNKDIKKAEETWSWIDLKTKKSTWNKDYLLWKNN